MNTTTSIKKINVYLLPIAAFFILISTAVTNLFLILTVFTAFLICIKNNNFDEIYKKDFFFKICFLIFILFVISSFYTIAEPSEILSTLKKYVKIIYIPFIFFYLKTYRNEKLVINFFIYGTTLILFLSYIKFLNVFFFENFYESVKFLNISGIKQNIIVTQSTVFQNYIIQGIVFSFYSFLCFFIATKKYSLPLYFLSFLAFFNVIFMNDSRIAYIIIFILFIFSFFKIISTTKIRILFFSFLVSISVLGFSINSQISNNFENRIHVINSNFENIQEGNYNNSLGMRYVWFKIGLDNFINKPVLGYGIGSFYKSAEAYFKKNNIINFYTDKNNNSEPISENNLLTNNPHSEIISISSQLGIIGLLTFSIFLYLILFNYTGPMSFATFIIVFVSSLFNSVFYDNMLGLFIIIIISLFYKNKAKI